MNIILQIKSIKYFILLTLFVLTGCSSNSSRAPSQPTASTLPAIPEIKRQQKVQPRYTPPKQAVVPKAVTPAAKVTPYSTKTVQTNKAPQLTKQQQIEQQQRIQQQAKQNATVDIDPYAAIPDNSSSNVVTTQTSSTSTKPLVPSVGSSSPAVKTLMTSARADIALGKSRSAISKLERGLRIEPQNAQLWHMLAKAHYANSAYLHSISMAKKSNGNTNNSDLINENWKLIKQAGERSGNASVIKEALDYMKLNP